MLTIRRAQLVTLQKARSKDYISRVVQHIHRCLGSIAADRSDEDLKSIIASGMHLAPQYGITSERDVCLFVDVMVMLGPGFDTKYPWAREILRDAATRPPGSTAQLLYQTARLLTPKENYGA